MGKKEIRAAMRALNNALTATERLTASTAIFSAIERLPEFRAARTIAFFSALPDEPATDEVLARWNETRRVVLPRVEGETMHFYSCRPETLRFGAFGILEPQGEEECGHQESGHPRRDREAERLDEGGFRAARFRARHRAEGTHRRAAQAASAVKRGGMSAHTSAKEGLL